VVALPVSLLGSTCVEASDLLARMVRLLGAPIVSDVQAQMLKRRGTYNCNEEDTVRACAARRSFWLIPLEPSVRDLLFSWDQALYLVQVVRLLERAYTFRRSGCGDVEGCPLAVE